MKRSFYQIKGTRPGKRPSGRPPSPEQEGEKIKRCPFCNGGNLRAASIMGDWRVICVDCGAQGPESKDKEGAMEAWNRRAAIEEEAINE